MASEVKTNKVSPVGTTLSVGDSGDTLALAVDAVTGLKVGSDAAGDILYYDGTDYTRREKPGTPADEVLTFATGASAPTWVAAAAGGLTAASQWRLSANFTNDSDPITSNLEEADAPLGFGVLGSSMTELSGIFTFPSTGYWYITFQHNFHNNTNTYERETHCKIYTTTDDSTYALAAEGVQSAGANNPYKVRGSALATYIFDVDDISDCKVKFGVLVISTTTTTIGNTDELQTGMTFLRLADRP